MKLKQNEYDSIVYALYCNIETHKSMAEDMRDPVDARCDAFNKLVVEQNIHGKLFNKYAGRFTGPNMYTEDQEWSEDLGE